MKITSDSKELQLPDFLVVGAARSGTSSLYFYLREHPEIFMPEFKEPHFFSFLGRPSPHPKRPPWALADYVELFDSAKSDQLIGEASASYLYFYEESIKNIGHVYRTAYRNVRIIMILRNPVERAWSYYMLRRRGGYSGDFFQAIREIEAWGNERKFHNFILSGMYYEQVKAYLEHFPYVNMLLFEELRSNPVQVFEEICEFLKLKDRSYLPKHLSTVYNISGEPRNWVLKPIYNMLFRESSWKNVLKRLVPYETGQKLKSDIGKRIVKRKEAPAEVREYLLKRFGPDIKRLLTIIDDSRRKEMIKKWLD